MKDRALIFAIVLPLVVGAGFAGYRWINRPVRVTPPLEQILRDAAIQHAQLRLGRPLTEEERRLVRVTPTEAGGFIASYDEPLHSRIPTTLPAATQPGG